MTYRDEIFENKTIALDDQEFLSCTFGNCRLVSSAGAPQGHEAARECRRWSGV
jgi:hypothetical protein